MYHFIYGLLYLLSLLPLKVLFLLSDFAYFLRPKPASLLKTVSRHGTIVMVNVSQYQSGALVLRSECSTIEHVQLVNATLDKLDAARRSFFKSLHTSGVRVRDVERKSMPGPAAASNVLARILEMLWIDVANPILDYLGYTVSRRPIIIHYYSINSLHVSRRPQVIFLALRGA